MGQVTLYLDSQTEEKMRAAAKAAGTSQSQWVASLIKERTTLEWPPSIAALAGTWSGDFPALEEIRRQTRDDAPREPL